MSSSNLEAVCKSVSSVKCNELRSPSTIGCRNTEIKTAISWPEVARNHLSCITQLHFFSPPRSLLWEYNLGAHQEIVLIESPAADSRRHHTYFEKLKSQEFLILGKQKHQVTHTKESDDAIVNIICWHLVQTGTSSYLTISNL